MSGIRPLAHKPWLDHYAPGVPDEIPEVTQTLPEMMRESANKYRNNIALEFFGAETSYRSLWRSIERVAEGLRKLGVRAGDPVAIILPNSPQHVVAFYAVLRLGAIVVEHNPLYTARELRHQFEDHHARVVIAWNKNCDMLADFPADIRPEHIVSVDLISAMPFMKQLLLKLPIPKARAAREALSGPVHSRGVIKWQKLAESKRISKRVPWPSVTDPALIQYTSGTTGLPKGAILSHRNLHANAIQGQAWAPGLRDGGEVVYGILPLFHAYGLTFCLTFALSTGAKLVLFPAFKLDLLIEAAKKTPPTFIPAVPPIYEALANSALKGELDLSQMRFALSGAMSLPVATVKKWEDTVGCLLVEGYGMTESSPISLGNPVGETRRPGTVGVPFPSTDIRIVDPSDPDVDLPIGERGELLVRGPQVFSGYWNKPLETAQTLLKDGWLRTGDIVTVSEDGFVTVVDRLKEIIITGGFNVAPTEVEEVLTSHPDVQEAAVVGLPRGSGGEQVVAAVVLRPDAAQDRHAIRDYCRGRLAAYKIPRRIEFVEELPRSLIGKIQRRLVRESLLSQKD